MKLALISDTHDNLPLIRKALTILREKGINIILHCGDLVAPIVVDEFKGFDFYYVRGNCDGDIVNIVKEIEKINGHYLKDFGIVDFGIKIGMYHGHNPELLFALRTIRSLDVLCYGHTHKPSVEFEEIGSKKLMIINPGTLHVDAKKKTFAILDTENMEVEFVEL